MLRHLLGKVVALTLLAGLFSALLARFSPGAAVDERELNPLLSNESASALAEERRRQLQLLPAVLGLLKGNLGYSRSKQAPIASLLAENAVPTARSIGLGLAGAWLLGLGTALAVARFRRLRLLEAAAGTFSAVLLCLPAAFLAYVAVALGAAAASVLTLTLAPRVFCFSRGLLLEAYRAPHVGMARAMGIPERRVLARVVLPSIGPQLTALAAASGAMAIAASIPIEAICDSAGLGRLAWQAAMARDLPLLIMLTMWIALAVSIASSIAETVSERLSR